MHINPVAYLPIDDTEPTVMCDFYKIVHRQQYPKGTSHVYSPWVPRDSRIPGVTEVVAWGFNGFIKKYLINYFNKYFFNRPKRQVVAGYQRIIYHTLINPFNKDFKSELEMRQEESKVDASHIEALWELGYLPIKIRAVKEGTLVPLRVPTLTIESTHDDFFWLTNYFETLMSAELWQPSTAATIALRYRKILDDYAMQTTGSTEGVDFQAHDFSMRGMTGREAAEVSGASHLLSFVGTDTIPAIAYLERYYNADITKELVGTSIPATEHSVMCSWGTDEYETFRALIEDIHPEGFVSIVSDTYDFWSILTETLPRLKDKIMSRNGKVVIRPDSGDPVKILIGDPEAEDEAVRKGQIEVLWDLFGGTVNELGYKVLDPHIGAIYGDSITPERAIAVSEGLKAKGFASINVVYGVGSYTYQYNTRDTFGYALKATHIIVNGEERKIFKAPKTDNGMKKSNKGRVVVMRADDKIVCQDDLTIEQQENLAIVDLLEDVFVDGKLVRDQSLSEIRALLKSQLA